MFIFPSLTNSRLDFIPILNEKVFTDSIVLNTVIKLEAGDINKYVLKCNLFRV